MDRILRTEAPDSALSERIPQALDAALALVAENTGAANDIERARRRLEQGQINEAGRWIRTAADDLTAGDIRPGLTKKDFSVLDAMGLLPAETLEAFVAAFVSHADRSDTDFWMACLPELMDELFGRSALITESTLISEIFMNNGMTFHPYTYWKDLGVFHFHDLKYTAGRRILRALQDGNAASLTDLRERSTGEEALRIAQQAIRASDTLTGRERFIHDLLCDRITYSRDETEDNDDDCAVGALLDGLANCDGYADAFYLCASLAGLNVRFQHGQSVPKDQEDEEEARDETEEDDEEKTHLWNLVLIDGNWVMTDVTWNDLDPDIVYRYYNIASDMASASYVWDAKAQWPAVASDTDAVERDADIAFNRVGSWDDIYALLLDSAARRPARLVMRAPDSLSLKVNRGRLSDLGFSTGLESFRLLVHDEYVEYYNMVYYDDFVICGTEDAALEYLARCAERDARSVRIYFAPALTESLFADERAGLDAMLSRSPLKDHTSYTYSGVSGYIAVDDPDYGDTPPAAADSEAVRAIVARGAAAGQDMIHFLMPAGGSYDTLSDVIGEGLYSNGCESYKYHVWGRRMTLYPTYKTEYRVCETGEDALEYISECAGRNAAEFTICFSPALKAELFADERAGISVLLSRSCLADHTTYRYSDSYGYIMVEEPVYGDVPSAAADSDAVRAIVARGAKAGQDTIHFLMPAGAGYDTLADSIGEGLYSNGCESYKYHVWGRRITLYPTYYADFRVCGSEEEALQYIAECASDRVSEFRLYFPAALAANLFADNQSGARKLLSGSRLDEFTWKYSSSCGYIVVYAESYL